LGINNYWLSCWRVIKLCQRVRMLHTSALTMDGMRRLNWDPGNFEKNIDLL
jgi:hypothetical protein